MIKEEYYNTLDLRVIIGLGLMIGAKVKGQAKYTLASLWPPSLDISRYFASEVSDLAT